MKAAVERIVVLSSTGRAQREVAHCGFVAVVGHILHDRKARPAVRAVGEGIGEAPIGRVKDLTQAIVAGGGVGRDQCAMRGAGPGYGRS